MTHIWDQWLEDAMRQKKERDKAERGERPKGQKCSNCLHHQGHPFSEKYHYCMKGKSSRTSHGYATTKRSAWCNRWEPEKP